MTKEIKIVLPAYKMLYSIAFFVILSLVRSITYTEEIGIAMQAPVAALTAVFCADTYIRKYKAAEERYFAYAMTESRHLLYTEDWRYRWLISSQSQYRDI